MKTKISSLNKKLNNQNQAQDQKRIILLLTDSLIKNEAKQQINFPQVENEKINEKTISSNERHLEENKLILESSKTTQNENEYVEFNGECDFYIYGELNEEEDYNDCEEFNKEDKLEEEKNDLIFKILKH